MREEYEASQLPSVDEILKGGTQGGVAPPPGYTTAEDGDGNVQRVGGGDFLGLMPAPQPATVAEAATRLKAARAAREQAASAVFEAERRLSDAYAALRQAQEDFNAAVAKEHGL